MSTETQPIPETKPVNLHLSETVARERVEEKKTAEQLVQEAEAERKRKRDERDAERRAARASEQAKRKRAADADKKLGEALDKLDSLREVANTSKKERERAEAQAGICRSKLRHLQTELELTKAELVKIVTSLDTPLAADLDTLTKTVEDAWSAHNDAWSALPKGYMKKHRDRAVRRRAKLAGIAGR